MMRRVQITITEVDGSVQAKKEVKQSKATKVREEPKRRRWQTSSLLDEHEEDDMRDDIDRSGIINPSQIPPEISSEEVQKEENSSKCNNVRQVSDNDTIDEKALKKDYRHPKQSATFESIVSAAAGVADLVYQATVCNSPNFEPPPQKRSYTDMQPNDTDLFAFPLSGELCRNMVGCDARLLPSRLLMGPFSYQEDDCPFISQVPIIVNRSSVPACQAKHVERMWNMWHPDVFDSSTFERKAAQRHVVGNFFSKSWDHGDADYNRLNRADSADELDSFNRVSAATLPQPPSPTPTPFSKKSIIPFGSKPPPVVTDLYYDSDPETFRRRLGHKTGQESRKGGQQEKLRKVQRPHHRLNLNNDKLVKDLISELTRCTVNLLWHKPTCASPVAIQGWFEMGSRLPNKLIQPKFMWRAAYQPSLGQKKLAASCRSPHCVDLLGLIKIIKLNSLDRSIYPFARIGRTLRMHVQSEEVYTFETSSSEDCDRFVQGLKLLVARLASMIISGDENIVSEFFSPWSHAEEMEEKARNRTQNEEINNKRFEKKRTQNEEINNKRFENKREVFGSAFVSTNEAQREELWGTKACI